jgi:hypothetical protein
LKAKLRGRTISMKVERPVPPAEVASDMCERRRMVEHGVQLRAGISRGDCGLDEAGAR